MAQRGWIDGGDVAVDLRLREPGAEHLLRVLVLLDAPRNIKSSALESEIESTDPCEQTPDLHSDLQLFLASRSMIAFASSNEQSDEWPNRFSNLACLNEH